VKQLVVQRALMLRRRDPALFATGGYEPLAVSGIRADNIIAFARSTHRRRAITVAPRLVLPLLDGADLPLPRSWDDTVVALPAGPPSGAALTDIFTGRSFDGGAGSLPVARLLERFPVALLVSG
jgi:(1->4)-alpha-D-glucan 1-alpha-D-glucosylmutase